MKHDIVAYLAANHGATFVSDTLNDLPFVRWDRLARGPDEFVVYGWIDRPDGRHDFIVVTFHTTGGVSHTTSSADRSEEISRLLYGHVTESGHVPCERVEDILEGLVTNQVKLPPPSDPSNRSR